MSRVGTFATFEDVYRTQIRPVETKVIPCLEKQFFIDEGYSVSGETVLHRRSRVEKHLVSLSDRIIG